MCLSLYTYFTDIVRYSRNCLGLYYTPQAYLCDKFDVLRPEITIISLIVKRLDIGLYVSNYQCCSTHILV